MAINMNKMIAPASNSVATAPYSDLDARTQFVLNRVEFLKSITEVLQHEDRAENKAKVIVWRDNNYIPLIVRCILDPNEEIYDHAIWATGNLLGSDDKQVSLMARNAVTEDVLKRVIELAEQQNLAPAVRRGVHYLIYNLTPRRMPRFFNEAVGCSLLKKVLTDERFSRDKEAHADFLAAVENIAKDEPTAVEEMLLVDALGGEPRPHGWRRILNIIGTLSEQDGMVCPTAINKLMGFFTKELEGESKRNGSRREMMWILSNLMTEFDAPYTLIMNHRKLKEIVQNIAWEELCSGADDADVHLGREALHVLANFIAGVKKMGYDTHPPTTVEDFRSLITGDFVLEGLFGACCDHENHIIARLGSEGLDLLDSFKPEVTAPEVIDLTGDSESEDTKSEVEDNGAETEEVSDEEDDCYCHGYSNNVPLARTNAAVSYHEEPVPSAADLLLGADRGNESANVRRVVALLVNLPVGEWAEVPADWTLTIADLTVLQHLGYVIMDGYVGINPEIYSGY
jgi:hypothetical protein